MMLLLLFLLLLLKESLTMQIFAINDDLLKESNVLLFISRGRGGHVTRCFPL